MKKYTLAIVFILLLAVVITVSGCASQSEVDRLQKENADLKQEVEDLKAQVPPAPEEPNVPASAAARPNPVANTAANIAAGKVLFDSACWVCHGKDGKGDGPAAENLDPKPIDFSTDEGFAADPDGDLEYVIETSGVPGTAMPAWEGAFTEQQIWTILRHERTFMGQ